MDKRRAVNLIYLDFSKAFGLIFNNILVDKLVVYGLDRWTTDCVENGLNS